MPESSNKLLDLLGVPAEKRMFADLGPSGRLTAETPLPAPSGVFPRYVEPENGAEG
jgi:methionyl-tRNA synthetase